MRRLVTLAGLLILLATPFCQATSIDGSSLVEQAVFKFEQLDKRNKYNDANGLKGLNEYVIELDPEWKLNPNWIEEKGNGEFKLVSDRYDRLSKLMKDFNDARADRLRFYIIVVNDYKVRLEETVDMKKLPSAVDHLGAYASLPNTQADYQRFRKEIASIPVSISAALEKAGYTDRIIYFYGLVRLYKLDQKSKYYRHDNLSILGEAIKPFDKGIRDASKKTVAAGDTEGAKIEGVANSIIEAIKLVVDKGDESKSLVDCGSSVSDMVTATAKLKEQHYANAITETVALLDNPTGAQMVGSRYMIVDSPEEFASDDLFTSTVMPDKLSLLANNKSKYKLYAVFKAIDFVLPTGEWKNFADAVAAKSKVAGDPKAIVMVIPYYKTKCIAKGWLFSTSEDTGLLMPAVYSADEGMKASMTAALAGAGKTWEANFNQAFSNIPKNYTAYDYKFLWNGDLIYDGVENYTDVKGYPELVEVRMMVDERFHQLNDAWSAATKCAGDATVTYGGQSYTHPETSLACFEAYGAAQEKIMNGGADFKVVKRTNLIQSRLTEDTAREFAFWYAKHKNWLIGSSIFAPGDDAFYGGKNPEKVNDMLALIDIASAVASFVGADALFDGLGAYYAYSNGEYTQAAFYTAAAAVPFLSSAVRRAVINGGEYVLKTMKGTFVTRPKNILGMNALLELNSYFSQFTIKALSLKSFNKAAKYKTEKKFIEALEEGMLADNNAIKALNDNPDLVDEFNAFHKEGKGNLNDFLTAKGAVKTLDISASLAAKLTPSGVSKLRAWFSNKTFKYADDAAKPARFLDEAAEVKMLEDLDKTIGDKKVLEVLEDEQGRLSVVLETDGVTYDLIALQKNYKGDDIMATYNRAYNQNANMGIDVGVSKNRLVPDYTKDMADKASTKYLYQADADINPVVKIKMTGRRSSDFIKANEAAGLTAKKMKTPKDYVWHHMDDFNPATGECTMQLVRSDAHTAVDGMAHSGSVAQWKQFYVESSNAPGGLFY